MRGVNHTPSSSSSASRQHLPPLRSVSSAIMVLLLCLLDVSFAATEKKDSGANNEAPYNMLTFILLVPLVVVFGALIYLLFMKSKNAEVDEEEAAEGEEGDAEKGGAERLETPTAAGGDVATVPEQVVDEHDEGGDKTGEERKDDDAEAEEGKKEATGEKKSDTTEETTEETTETGITGTSDSDSGSASSSSGSSSSESETTSGATSDVTSDASSSSSSEGS